MYNVYHIQLIKVNTNEGNYSLIISMNIAAFIKEIRLLLQSIWHFLLAPVKISLIYPANQFGVQRWDMKGDAIMD